MLPSFFAYELIGSIRILRQRTSGQAVNATMSRQGNDAVALVSETGGKAAARKHARTESCRGRLARAWRTHTVSALEDTVILYGYSVEKLARGGGSSPKSSSSVDNSPSSPRGASGMRDEPELKRGVEYVISSRAYVMAG